MRRSFLASLLALALTGCSYHYDLKAVELSGRIAFMPMKDKGSGCFADFKVTSETGEVVWELSASQYLPPPCQSDFPVVYGTVPHDMAARVKAKPLTAGVTYRVEGWDGDGYSGAFRFRQGIVVDNIKVAP
ncbi:MAG: hypothetical protein ABIS09_08915 [Sphingomicrobium sp.]